MAVSNIKMSGFESVMRKVKKLGAEVQAEVVEEVRASAFQIQGDARRLVPKDTGRLAQSITLVNVPSGVVLSIGAGVVYAPYVEWGTGTLVRVPNDFKRYAIQFKGRGVREVNLKARPYIYPALQKEIPLLVKRIKAILKTFK